MGASWGRNECASGMVCLLGPAETVGAVIRAGPMSTCPPQSQSFSQALCQCLEVVPVEKLGGKEAGKIK